MMKFPLNNFPENIQHDIKSDSANLSKLPSRSEGKPPERKITAPMKHEKVSVLILLH